LLFPIGPVFHTGNTYLYGYRGFIWHGLPSRGVAIAGVKLTCNVEIGRVSHSDHILQVRSPRLEEYNGFWPVDSFTSSSKLTEAITACLSQAFKFEYIEGRVGNIFAPEDCPILCINLVRGILNAMQITIKKTQNVYEIQEAGIEGICQTRYVIQDDSRNNHAVISKSKDLMNCQEKAVKNVGMAYIRPCPTCPLRARNVKGTEIFTYKMKYDDSGALMISAMSKQVYQISPFNEPDGAAIMEARQELFLIDVKRTPISAPKTKLQNQGSLRYDFSGELLQMPIPLIRIKNPDLQLTETLRQIVKKNEEGANKEASIKFLQMVQLFRVVTFEQIESVWVKFANEFPYRPWLLSAICAAGATDTFRFLKQIIHDEKLNLWEATGTLLLAFHFVTPNKQTLEVASSFLTCPQIQKAPLHRTIVYLGYGSMVNKHCAQTSVCPNELIQPIHDLATEAISKGDAKDMALALKAIGNAGELASIKRILRFLPTFSLSAASLPNRIHVDAVLALRKIARKDPIKVKQVSLQVFMDNKLAPNVRMVACIVLFETKPSLPTITALASALLTETSLQVASFAYSHMKALATGKIPQLYHLAAACNLVVKILSPKLGRLSYRYSKVLHLGGYSSEYQVGGIWRVYLMNTPSSVFPSDIITKVRGYYANSATDIIEVALRSQGLTELLRKQNLPFAEYDTYKALKELSKTLLGWKELAPENFLLSTYIKVLGQEIAFADIDKETIQKTITSLTGPSGWQSVLKKVVQDAQQGVSWQWTLPVMVGELRHVIPTVVGLPLELSLSAAALAQTAAQVDAQISPPLPDNFKPLELLETNINIHADIKPKAYFHTIAMMGVNTQYFQSGLEFHAEFSANTATKFNARMNIKEKNLTVEIPPCHEEIELAAVRSEAHAISRNMEEVDFEKKSQLIPKEEPSTNHPVQPQESSSGPESLTQSDIPGVIPKGYKQGSEEERYHSIEGKLYTYLFCRKIESWECSACLSLKSQSSDLLPKTYLHKLAGEFEAKIVLKPVHTDAVVDKIQLEIQAGPKAASKIIDVARSGSKEEDGTSPHEDFQTKLKKILRFETVFQVGNKTHHRRRRVHRTEKSSVTHLWADPGATSLSSSSSSSTEHKSDEIKQSHGSSSSDTRRSSTSISFAYSKICSSSREDHSGDCSGYTEYFKRKLILQQLPMKNSLLQGDSLFSQESAKEVLNISISSSSSSASDEGISRAVSQPKFLGDSKQPVLAAVLRAIYKNKPPTGLQLVLYTETQPTRSRTQVFASSITGSSSWKLCADSSVINSHKVMGLLKWGKDCQDYQIATQTTTGQFSAYPAMQMKWEWPKVPSTARTVARWFYSYLPGMAYMLGYSQRQQRAPSHQATLVMALTSPRTCDVVFKLPELTIYNRAIRLPMSFPSSPGTWISTVSSPNRNFFSQATLSIIENLKARCSVFQSKITTFNGVEFNYSMPQNCNHVLVQDCSPELKFLVTMKRLEESADLTAINVRLASHEVDMYVSNGLIQLKINGVKVPTDVPYTSNSDASMLISSEKEGLSLKAPDYGIDKLYYDGHRLQIQVPFWMAGKTCGICGKYDAEKEREYQMPSGYLAKDAVSFGQSWIISEDSCAGACKLRRKLVKIEKSVAFERKAMKCFSVEPVLQCAEGCSPTDTVSVSVGFRCGPADSALDAEGQMKLSQKPEDVVSAVPAHTACSCPRRPCPA
ncbi:VIT2 protein, partial [Urocolius indicus]|nr:VIT2 protein [Urocolius indicus]